MQLGDCISDTGGHGNIKCQPGRRQKFEFIKVINMGRQEDTFWYRRIPAVEGQGNCIVLKFESLLMSKVGLRVLNLMNLKWSSLHNLKHSIQ